MRLYAAHVMSLMCVCANSYLQYVTGFTKYITQKAKLPVPSSYPILLVSPHNEHQSGADFVGAFDKVVDKKWI